MKTSCSFTLPTSLNTQDGKEALVHHLPHKLKALSWWNSLDIHRINPEQADNRRISGYLGKSTRR